MVLGAIAAHDVGVAPVVVVGEQQRLAEQGRPQLLPGRLLGGLAQGCAGVGLQFKHENLLGLAVLDPVRHRSRLARIAAGHA